MFLKLKIFTQFNSYIRRNRIRFLVRQDPKVIWFTGLSGAGKTTLANGLNRFLLRKGYFTKQFDGDEIRHGLNKDLGYSIEDRIENIRRTAEVAKLFADHGIVVICSFISPTRQMRQMVRESVGKDRFIEVFVNCPLEVCEKRDVKGLYKKARQGLITDFTGIGSIYEIPEHPDIEVRTDVWSEKNTLKYLNRRILPEIRYIKFGIQRFINNK
jgi:adenylylsulfate kinase